MLRLGSEADDPTHVEHDGDLPEGAGLSSDRICALCGGDRDVEILCSARDWEYGVPGQWTLARCRVCDYYYQVPRPSPGLIPSFYPPTYSAYGADPAIDWLFRVTFWLDAQRVVRLIGRRGRVLDVGCGAGAALGAMQRAGEWELYGLEIDADAVRRAQARGLKVQQGDLFSADFAPDSFDLIRMGHVIEHVLDPLAMLRRAHELLRPGGVLVGETPNVACWDFRLLGRYWGALHFPRHIGFFSERTLRRVCVETGFHQVEITSRLRTVGWSAGIQNWLVDRWGLRVPAHGRVRWYAALIMPFLPVTLLQSLVSRPATIAFIAHKAAGAR